MAGEQAGQRGAKGGGGRLVTGAHVIVESADPEADRAFFREVLDLPWIEAGGGWPIFALPPTELAVHPGGAGHQLYLVCDDLAATLAALRGRGIEVLPGGGRRDWGELATIRLPGGGELSIYQPSHPRATG